MARRIVIGVAVLCVGLGVAGCGGGKKSQADYVKANHDLAAKLPAYPHAKLTGETTTGYTAGTSTPLGYETLFHYALPAKASVQRVEAFYVTRLGADWKQVAALTGPVLNYRNGNAFVSLDLTGVKTHVLTIVVDDGFYSHIKTG